MSSFSRQVVQAVHQQIHLRVDTTVGGPGLRVMTGLDRFVESQAVATSQQCGRVAGAGRLQPVGFRVPMRWQAILR